MAFNMDESPENREWLHSKWRAPEYKSEPFFKWLKHSGLTLAEFKRGPMYQRAVNEGAIVDDVWVPEAERRRWK